jgi:hypothetical protein
MDKTLTVVPEYPLEMAKKGMQGWVEMSFNIYPDGHARDIQIVDDMPKGGFSKEAIKSLQQYKFVNGSDIAQLIYAKEVANMPSPTDEQIELATKYLVNYAKNSYKTIQWYQVNALVNDKMNKHSDAMRSIKKAIRQAKKIGWDLTELKQQKALIKQRMRNG